MLATMTRGVARVLAYGLFIAVIGCFSRYPRYVYVDPGMAVIKMAFSHAGQRKEKCRRLSPEEIQKLAPNMRRSTQCTRERLPITVELYLDQDLLYEGTLAPAGLWKDGQSTVYERFVVNPGLHRLTARLRDSHRSEGFDYENSTQVRLQAGQNFVVGFRAELGGFTFN